MLQPLTEPELRTVLELLEGVTAGPWRATTHDRHTLNEWWTVDKVEGMPRQIARVMAMRPHDAQFIAVAREVVPRLIAEVQRHRSKKRKTRASKERR